MNRRSALRWLVVVAWIAVIYTTIPFVRSLREYFVAQWPAELIGLGVVLVVVAVCAAGLLFLRGRRLPVANAVMLLAVAAVLVIWTWRLMGQPEETVHFLEYGGLGVLLFRALRTHIHDSSIFVAGALIGILVGIFDEIIQWYVPGRYWDFRDIALNGGASILVQIAISRLAPAPLSPINRGSWRRLCRLAAAVIMLLTVCLAATPLRVNRLAELLPTLEELGTLDEAMAEYGHLHRLDELTSFRSRLSLGELMTTAYRENLILERIFSVTMGHSSYPWPPPRRTQIEAAQDEHAVFVSKVGGHLITAVSESGIRLLMVAILIALVSCDLLLGYSVTR